MNARPTLALLAVLAAVGGAAVLVQVRGAGDGPREHARVFPGLVAADVRAIRASGAGADLLLERGGAGWTLGAAKEAADGPSVERLLADLAELEVGAVVSRNAAKQSGYGADAATGVTVRLEGSGSRPLAAFTVGRSGPDMSSSYLRREGASEVLLVSRNLREEFTRPAAGWREPPKPAGSPAPADLPAKQ